MLPGFAVEDGDGLAVELAGGLVAVPDAYGAELAVLGEGSDQVEHHALLGGAVEVETVVHGDVYEVVGGETLVGQALEVVRGIVVAGLRRGRAVQPVVSVVGPVGQETKDQVRMGVPPLRRLISMAACSQLSPRLTEMFMAKRPRAPRSLSTLPTSAPPP